MKRALKKLLFVLIMLMAIGLILTNKTKGNIVAATDDKTSKSLIIKSEDISKISNSYETISEEDKLYLLKYDSFDDANKTYELLKKNKLVQEVIPNTTLQITEKTEKVENEEDIIINKNIKNIDINEEDYIIALIDTGVTEEIPNVIGEVSVIEGENTNSNNHGTRMAKEIIKENPDAKILSIKALDDNGHGTVASVYMALKFAIESNVDIINLSLSGYSNSSNNLIAGLVKSAIDKGIIVVGSAGNDGENANSFIPSNIEDVIVVGTANSDGTRNESSNYGKKVDYFVEATSSSVASAKMTGKLSKSIANEDSIGGILASLVYDKEIFQNDEKYEDELKVEIEVPGFDTAATYTLAMGVETEVGKYIYDGWTYQRLELRVTAKLIGYTVDNNGNIKAKVEFRNYCGSYKKRDGATVPIQWAADIKYYVDNTEKATKTYPRPGEMVIGASNVRRAYDGTNDNFKWSNPTSVWYTSSRGELVQGPVTLEISSGTHSVTTRNVNYFNPDSQGEDLDMSIKVPFAVILQINRNGGTLATSHGGDVAVSGNYITINNSKVIHSIVNGSSLDSNGIEDYNDSTKINLQRTGYKIADSQKVYYATINNTTKYFNQTSAYSSADFGGAASNNNSVDLYVNWTANSYKINYTLNGGTAGTNAPTTATYDQVVQISNPTRAGYTFAGWTMTNGNTSTAKYGTSSTNVSTAWNPASTKVTAQYFKNLTATDNATVTLTANWTANTATITVKKDGVGWTNSGINVALYSGTTLKYSYANSTHPTGTSTVSWSGVVAGTYNVYASKNENDKTTLVDTGVDVTVSTTGTATINYYTLELRKGTGIASVTPSTIIAYLNNQSVSISNTVSAGYTWANWSKISGNNPASTTAASTTVTLTSKTVLQANATTNVATISIRVNNENTGSTGLNVALYSGTTLKYSYANATVSGANVSWSAVTAGTYKVYASKNSNEKTSLIDTGVTITIPSSGSASVDFYTLEVTAGVNVSAVSGGATYLKNQTASITATVNTGYHFNNWTVTTGNTPASVTSPSTTVKLTSKTQLVANVLGNESNLQINPNGGSTVVTKNGTNTTVSTTTSFTGNYEELVNIPNPTKSNQTVPTNYTVTYKYNADGMSDTTATATKRVMTFYRFSSWTVNNNMNGTLVQEGSSHKYTFGPTAGATDTMTATYTESTSTIPGTVRLPSPTWEGHIFVGWYTASSGGNLVGRGGDNYTVNQNITLYGRWAEEGVTVTIYKDNAEWTPNSVRVELHSVSSNLIYDYDNDAIKNGATVSWVGVVPGIYDIYASSSASNLNNLVDTGEDVYVASGQGESRIDYYTLSLDKDTNINSVSGAGTYLKNSVVTITAVPKENKEFLYWKSERAVLLILPIQPADPLSATTTIKMTKKANLTAYGEGIFAKRSLLIDPNGGNGSITTVLNNGGGSIMSIDSTMLGGTVEPKAINISVNRINGITNGIVGPITPGETTRAFTSLENVIDYNNSKLDHIVVEITSKSPSTGTANYRILYDGNSGLVGEITDSNTLSQIEAETAYSFDSWETSETVNGYFGFPTLGKFNYVFNSSISTYVDTIKALYNETTSLTDQNAVILPNATKVGYVLTGWYTAKTGGTRVGGAGDSYTPNVTGQLYDISTGDVTNMYEVLYARWALASSTLSVNPNGGTVSVKSPSSASAVNITSTQTYTQNYNTTLTLGTPTKGKSYPVTNYIITYDAGDGTPARPSDTSSRTDTVTYAFDSWARSSNFYGELSADNKVYTFPPENGVTSTITANYNSTIAYGTPTAVTLPAATRTGYTLKGWYTASTGGAKRGNAGDTYVPSGSETLYAQWDANTAMVTIKVDDVNTPGTGINVALYKSGSVKYAYGAATINGENVSWNAVASGTYDIYASKNTGALTTLADTGVDITIDSTGSAAINFYTLELRKGEGVATVTPNTIITYLKNQSVSINTTVSTGYDWANWTKILGNNPASTTTASTTVSMTTKTILQSNATIHTANLTVNPNGGSVVVTSPTGGTAETITENKTYTQNYNTTLTLGTPQKEATTQTVTYTVTYNGNSGTVGTTTPENTTSTRTDTITYAANSSNKWTKSSTFYGTLSSDGTTYTYPANKNVTSTITANYTSTTTPGTQSSVILPTVSRTGYTLKGWYTAATNGTKVGDPGGTYTPSGNVTIYAQWTINSSSLSVNPNGGTVNVKSPSSATGVNITTTKTYTQNYNTTLTLGTPTKTPGGYTVTIGVEYDGNGGTPAKDNDAATRTDTINYTFDDWEEIETFYGSLSQDNKTYTYGAENGVTSSIIAKYNSTTTTGTPTSVTLPTATKTGYNLSGWYTATSGGTRVGGAEDSYTPTTETILHAQWTEKTATLSYNANGHGTAPASVTMKYTTATNAASALTATGYTFTGWNTKADGSGTSYAAGAQVKAANVEPVATTLYAQWRANTATITIRKDNSNWSSSGINVALYQNGTSKYAYSAATKSGATVSWSTVTAGTYDVYASKSQGTLTTLIDTGINVTVTSTGTATIDYYTLTLNKGVGISAVSGAGTYLKNQAANIDATVSAGYTWQGWSVVSGNTPN